MKAFITNSNAKSIVYKLKVEDINTDEEIYKLEFKWFSNMEVKSLLAFKLLFQNSDEFFKKYKKFRPVDRKEFIFEGQPPSHHNDSDCERLHSSFSNFKIPEEIKSKGEEAITGFRNWFKEHMHLMEGSMDLFLDRMKWKFGLSERPKVVDYKNSGVELIDSIDLVGLENRIDGIILNANNFYTRNNKNRIILDNFGKNSFIWKERKQPYKNNTGYSNDDIFQVLQEFDENYKAPISFLLREYYKVKYNPELEFEGHLLEQLGFRPCHQCYDSEYLEKFANNSTGEIDLGNSSRQSESTDNLPF